MRRTAARLGRTQAAWRRAHNLGLPSTAPSFPTSTAFSGPPLTPTPSQPSTQIVDRLEALLRLKRFNMLGGLQLDRDVRALVSTLADVTQRSVRDKFARLSQIATILSLESVDELRELWGADSAASVTWRLTETQVREVLSQRFDFDQAAISMLNL